jgi:hypothetical protein
MTMSLTIVLVLSLAGAGVAAVSAFMIGRAVGYASGLRAGGRRSGRDPAEIRFRRLVRRLRAG